jgi:hypothetical protein
VKNKIHGYHPQSLGGSVVVVGLHVVALTQIFP